MRSFNKFFSEQPPLTLDRKIGLHLKKLHKEINDIKDAKNWQFTISEDYKVNKHSDANFALYGGGWQHADVVRKCNKVCFLQEIYSTMLKGELNSAKLDEILIKYPNADLGLFSETGKIINLLKKETGGSSLEEKTINCSL